MNPFQQPPWTADSGQPYPGAEQAAQVIAQDAEVLHVQELAKGEKVKAQARRKGQQLADAEDEQLRTPLARKASTIRPKRVRWLWDGRVPLGELTLIAGKGGVGKSTLLGTLAGWITVGDMRGEYDGTPRDVLYVANEDSLEYTVVPRLIAAGADLNRVHFFGMQKAGRGDQLILPTDCKAIGDYAQSVGAVAVMLDPLSSNLSGKRNEGDVMRPVLEAVRRMSEQHGMATLGLAHTRKGQSSDLMEAIMGSSELGNICRSAMGVMADPDEDNTIVLSQEKNNLGKSVPSYKYRINTFEFFTDTQELASTSRLEFLGKTDMNVSDMLSDAGSPATKEAIIWLRGYLGDNGGEASRRDIMAEGQKERIPASTIERAARKMRLVFSRQGYPSTSHWSLPEGKE